MGVSTHHHDQLMTPVNFSTINTMPSKLAKLMLPTPTTLSILLILLLSTSSQTFTILLTNFFTLLISR